MSIADICAFIAAEETRLKDKFKTDIDGISLSITTKGARVCAFGARDGYRYNYQCGEASTPDEAAERLCTEHFPSPEVKAVRLREQARDLLRVAADLEKGGAK